LRSIDWAWSPSLLASGRLVGVSLVFVGALLVRLA
jgi:hypothetical protein